MINFMLCLFIVIAGCSEEPAPITKPVSKAPEAKKKIEYYTHIDNDLIRSEKYYAFVLNKDRVINKANTHFDAGDTCILTRNNIIVSEEMSRDSQKEYVRMYKVSEKFQYVDDKLNVYLCPTDAVVSVNLISSGVTEE